MFSPIQLYRLARYFYLRDLPLLAKFCKLLNFLIFKALIPYEVQIGEGAVVQHQGVGLVMHPHCVIGDDVKIHHNVTLATDVPMRSPERMVIGDRVTIYPHSVIVGPRKIGSGAIIGAGSVVTHDIPENAVAYGNPARVRSIRATQHADAMVLVPSER